MAKRDEGTTPGEEAGTRCRAHPDTPRNCFTNLSISQANQVDNHDKPTSQSIPCQVEPQLLSLNHTQSLNRNINSFVIPPKMTRSCPEDNLQCGTSFHTVSVLIKTDLAVSPSKTQKQLACSQRTMAQGKQKSFQKEEPGNRRN